MLICSAQLLVFPSSFWSEVNESAMAKFYLLSNHSSDWTNSHSWHKLCIFPSYSQRNPHVKILLHSNWIRLDQTDKKALQLIKKFSLFISFISNCDSHPNKKLFINKIKMNRECNIETSILFLKGFTVPDFKTINFFIY